MLGAVGKAFQNPSAIGSVIGESVPASVVTAAGSIAVPLGMGASSGVTEFASSILDFLGEKGVNTADKAALTAALSDANLMAEARIYAGKRAAAVGAMDALGGALIRPIARTTERIA